MGMFPLFLKRTADVMAPHLSALFWQLVRLGSFPACWRKANVTPVPKGPLSSSVTNYQPISITSVLSKVFECLVSDHLGRFMECSGVLPTTQFAYQEGLGTCDALLGPFVPAQVTCSALVAHRYTYAPPRCRTLQYSRTFIPFLVSLWNNLPDPIFDGVGLAGFHSRANASLLA